MRSYRIVIDYTDASARERPDYWDWRRLIAPESDEAITFISAEEIITPERHLEDLSDV